MFTYSQNCGMFTKTSSARHIKPAHFFTDLQQQYIHFFALENPDQAPSDRNRIPTQSPICFISIKTPDHELQFQKGRLSIMDS